MSLEKLRQWANKNRAICYSLAAACLLLLHGVFLFAAVSYAKSTLFLTVIVVIVWSALCFLFFLQKKRENRIHRVFIVSLLTLGVLYSAVFLPGSAPDETHHFESSYKYSNFLMFKNSQADSIPVRTDDKTLIQDSGRFLSYSRYISLLDNFELFSSNPRETSIKPVSSFPLESNPPQLKLASALGITIARLLGLGSYPLYYLGRFFNFLLFAILCFFAVKITPLGKNTFMAISLLPMTLHITSSYSYDAGILGLSFLFIALCLKAIYTTESISRKDFIAIALVAFLLAPCKVLYALLIFMVVLIPIKAFSSKRSAVLFKTGVPLLSMLSILLMRLPGMFSPANVGEAATSALLLRGTDQGYTHSLSELFSDPLGTGLIFMRTLDSLGDWYLSTTIGGSLGWFQGDIKSPWFIVILFAIPLVLSFLKTPSDELSIPFKHKILYLVIFCCGLFAVMLSMFVGHTFDYENIILGVQGRYLLPFIPLIALLFRNNTIVSKRNLLTLTMFSLLALNLAYLVRIVAYASLV
ncbi:MAG: DUF2142 domain-containing protein [Eggerthellaceae bacterium]|nr:DUF2142 domain-containing protein [Eggerthellaceae bacterium]